MKETEKIKIGALYGRVSVDAAAEVEHGSLEQQENMGRDLAARITSSTGQEHRIKYVLIEDRGVSGGTTKRPKYQELTNLVTSRKIDFVIAKEISRISRSTIDFCNFMNLCHKNNVAVHIRGIDADPTTPMGSMLFKLMAVLAEFERSLIIQRTRDGTRSSMLNNSKINGGNVLLGFRRKKDRAGFWEVDPEKIQQVEFLMKRFVETGSKQETIAEAKRLGIKNAKGKPLTIGNLNTILKSPKYVGKMLVKHPGESKHERTSWVSLPHGEVVPIALFEQVQAQLKKQASGKKNQNRLGTRVYLLSGILQHEDGSTLSGTSGTGRSGIRRYYYSSKIHKLTIDAEAVEKAVLSKLEDYCRSEKKLEDVVQQLRSKKLSQLELLKQQENDVRRTAKDLQMKEEGFTKILMTQKDGSTPETLEMIEAQLSKHKKQKEELSLQLVSIEKDRTDLQTNETEIKTVKTKVDELLVRLKQAAPLSKRTLLRSIFQKIELRNGNEIKIYWGFNNLEGGKSTGDLVFPGIEWLAR